MAVNDFRTPRSYPPQTAREARAATCPFCGTTVATDARLCRGCEAVRGVNAAGWTPARAYWTFTAPFLLFCAGLAGCVYVFGRSGGGWLVFLAGLTLLSGGLTLRALPHLYSALREETWWP